MLASAAYDKLHHHFVDYPLYSGLLDDGWAVAQGVTERETLDFAKRLSHSLLIAPIDQRRVINSPPSPRSNEASSKREAVHLGAIVGVSVDWKQKSPQREAGGFDGLQIARFLTALHQTALAFPQ